MDKERNISPLLIRPGFLFKNRISLFPAVSRAITFYQGLISKPLIKTDDFRKTGFIRSTTISQPDPLKRCVLDTANLSESFVLGPGHALYPLDMSTIHTLLPFFIMKNRGSAEFKGSREFMQPPSPLFSSMIHTKGAKEDNQIDVPLHFSLPFQKETDFMMNIHSLSAASITHGTAKRGAKEAGAIHLHTKKPTMFCNMQSDFRADTGNFFPTFPPPTISKNRESAEFKGSREFMQPPSPLFYPMIRAKGAMEGATDSGDIRMPINAPDSQANICPYPFDSGKNTAYKASGGIIGSDMVNVNFTDNGWGFLQSQLSQSDGASLEIIPRLTMEKFFPHSGFSDVRIHTDMAADRASRALGADAFTLGRDIFFKAGSFRPDSIEGLALLGHELVHVHQFEHGFIDPSSSHQTVLERDALNAEKSLSRIPFGKDHKTNKVATYFNGGANPSFSPSRKDLRSMQSSSPHQSTKNIESFNISAGTGFSGNVPCPMKADEGRELAPETNMTANTPSQQEGENNVEKLSHQIYRYIERQITLDKERRGIDRWDH